MNTRILKQASPILIVVGVLAYFEFFRKKQMKKVNQLVYGGALVERDDGTKVWVQPKDETIEAPRTYKTKTPLKGDDGYYAGSKSVSKLLGVNQGMQSMGAVIGYMVLGVAVGLYTGTSLVSKARRVVIFGVGFPLSATIIGGVGDIIVTKFKNK